jgi:hypothetical protein
MFSAAPIVPKYKKYKEADPIANATYIRLSLLEKKSNNALLN